MNVAEARYTGRMRSANRRVPASNTSYRLPRYDNQPEREWVAVTSADDARWLAEQDDVEVRWNRLGQLQAASGDALEVLAEWSYRQKQKLVQELNLDVPANSAEDDLETAIHEYVEETDAGDL